MANYYFDTKNLGRTIQQLRKNAGYKTCSEFSKAIENKTGQSISDETLKKLEQGKGAPSIERFIAMCIVLLPSSDSDRFVLSDEQLKTIMHFVKPAIGGDYALRALYDDVVQYDEQRAAIDNLYRIDGFSIPFGDNVPDHPLYPEFFTLPEWIDKLEYLKKCIIRVNSDFLNMNESECSPELVNMTKETIGYALDACSELHSRLVKRFNQLKILFENTKPAQ